MKFNVALSLAVVLTLVGCASHEDVVVRGEDGTTAKVSANGAKIETTAPDGTKSEMTTGRDGGIEFKDSKGQSMSAGVGKVSESDLGVPFYPGSKEDTSGSFMADTSDGKSISCLRTTPDDPDKVQAFYKVKIETPTDSSTTSNGMKMVVMGGKQKDGHSITITAIRDAGATETKISIGVQIPKK